MSISVGVPSSSPIPDYATLLTTVGDWLDRDDLAAKIPMFVQMAEAMFNRELRTREMETSTLLTASDEDVALPSDYLAMRAIYVEGSPDRPLRGTVPTALREEYDGSVGTPELYALIGGGLRLIPPPDSAIVLHVDYFARIQALSDASTSNWLLEKHPDAYLYGTLFNAEAFLDNSTRAAQWKGLLDAVIDRINTTAQGDRYGPAPIARGTCKQVGGSRC